MLSSAFSLKPTEKMTSDTWLGASKYLVVSSFQHHSLKMTIYSGFTL